MPIRSLDEIRNKPNPHDQLEIEYQRSEVKQACDKLIEKYRKEPEFLRAVAIELASEMLKGSEHDVL